MECGRQLMHRTQRIVLINENIHYICGELSMRFNVNSTATEKNLDELCKNEAVLFSKTKEKFMNSLKTDAVQSSERERNWIN